MKIENEITGEIAEEIESYVGIRLHICDEITDFFAVDTKEKEIITRLNATTKILLKIEHTYDDYIKLLDDLGLDIHNEHQEYWTPKIGEGYFYVDSSGEICPDTIHKTGYYKTDIKRYENYNAFPSLELAEKALNLSKLDRLILLWQYKNDCLFTPDWKNVDQPKHSVIYVYVHNKLRVDTVYTVRENKFYFETKEQAEEFVKMHSEEIKKIMAVI